MSLQKVNYIDKETIITAQNLNNIQDSVIELDTSINSLNNEIEEIKGVIGGPNDGYSLPVATTNKLGGVKSGGDVTIDASGLISVADGAIGTSNIAAQAVSRAKLAQDALYSPVKLITDGYSIQPEDVGVFLYKAYNSDVGITLTKAASVQLVSHGPEFPIVNWGGGSVTITGSGGIVFCVNGETSTFLNKAIKITEPNTTIALKKMGVNSSGEVWFVIGNVEVVS